ncbi:MAG: hypothetical protein ACK4SY_10580 [Pyrobaculum sp.]
MDLCRFAMELANRLNGIYGVYRDGQRVCGTAERHDCDPGFRPQCGEAARYVFVIYGEKDVAYVVV